MSECGEGDGNVFKGITGTRQKHDAVHDGRDADGNRKGTSGKGEVSSGSRKITEITVRFERIKNNQRRSHQRAPLYWRLAARSHLHPRSLFEKLSNPIHIGRNFHRYDEQEFPGQRTKPKTSQRK